MTEEQLSARNLGVMALVGLGLILVLGLLLAGCNEGGYLRLHPPPPCTELTCHK